MPRLTCLRWEIAIETLTNQVLARYFTGSTGCAFEFGRCLYAGNRRLIGNLKIVRQQEQ
jgi:hypothetical protein